MYLIFSARVLPFTSTISDLSETSQLSHEMQLIDMSDGMNQQKQSSEQQIQFEEQQPMVMNELLTGGSSLEPIVPMELSPMNEASKITNDDEMKQKEQVIIIS